MNLENTGLIKVHDHLSIIDPRLGADAISVLGARISRSRDLNKRAASMFKGIDIEQLFWSHEQAAINEDVAAFLEDNLGGYGHSSIADMAPIAFYLHGVPLSVCWLLEDFALFKGMETSTRAVKYTPRTPQALFCNNPAHEDYLNEYAKCEVTGKGYKYDQSRYLLPSSVPQGVVICGSVRDIFAHIRNLRCFPWLDPLVEWASEAIRLLAPKTWEQLAPKLKAPRPDVPYKWRTLKTCPVHGASVEFSSSDLTSFSRRFWHADLPVRKNTRTYMDPIFGNIHVNIGFNISWVSARDFHRHRPGGDWLLSIPTIEDRWIFMNMDAGQLKQCESQSSHTHELARRKSIEWEDLSQIPSGTLVRMERCMPLNYLVYMLELRAKTPGRNFEYAAISVQLMEQLLNQLDELANPATAMYNDLYHLKTIAREILHTQRLAESYREMQELNTEQMTAMEACTFNELPPLGDTVYR